MMMSDNKDDDDDDDGPTLLIPLCDTTSTKAARIVAGTFRGGDSGSTETPQGGDPSVRKVDSAPQVHTHR